MRKPPALCSLPFPDWLGVGDTGEKNLWSPESLSGSSPGQAGVRPQRAVVTWWGKAGGHRQPGPRFLAAHSGTKQWRLLDLASASFTATSCVPCLALLSVQTLLELSCLLSGRKLAVNIELCYRNKFGFLHTWSCDLRSIPVACTIHILPLMEKIS